MQYGGVFVSYRWYFFGLVLCSWTHIQLISANPSPNLHNEYSHQLQSGLPKANLDDQLSIRLARSWRDLHGEWGKKRKRSVVEDHSYDPHTVEKKAWQNLQTGWGKRFVPSEDDMAIQQLATMIDQQQPIEPLYFDYGYDTESDFRDVDKRNWQSFNQGWGKRDKWTKMRGAWGKREPAWVNLKGIWGKRSYDHTA